MGWLLLIGIVVFIIWYDIDADNHKVNLKKETAKAAAMGVGGYMIGKAIAKKISGVDVESKFYK